MCVCVQYDECYPEFLVDANKLEAEIPSFMTEQEENSLSESEI